MKKSIKKIGILLLLMLVLVQVPLTAFASSDNSSNEPSATDPKILDTLAQLEEETKTESSEELLDDLETSQLQQDINAVTYSSKSNNTDINGYAGYMSDGQEGTIKSNEGINVQVDILFNNSSLEENAALVYSTMINLQLDIKMEGTSIEGQTVNFKLPDGFNFKKTFVDRTTSMQYDNETIANIKFSGNRTNMEIAFTKSVEFNVEEFKAEIGIDFDSNKYQGIITNGGSVDIYLGVDNYCLPKKVKVTFKISEGSLFAKTNGSYNVADQMMLYNIKVTTKLSKTNPEDANTIHYILDMPQKGLRFKENSLALFERTAVDTFGNMLFSSTSPNNNTYQIYRVFYSTSDSEGKYRAITKKDHFQILDFINPLTNQPFDSLEAATFPVGLKCIPLSDPIPAELENEPYGFLLKIINNPTSRLIIRYENEVYNTEYAVPTSTNPILYNDASYYAQEIPTCDTESQQCTPIRSEVDVKSSRGEITTGEIIVKIKYGNIGIRKQSKEDATLLAGAKFNLLDHSGNIVVGKYNDVNCELKDIESHATQSSNTNNLFVKTQDGTEVSLEEISIPSGSYTIEEIETPEGYEKTTQPISIVVIKDVLTPYIILNTKDTIETELSQKGQVIVHYVDESGNQLAEPVVLKGDINTDYTAEQKAISGYVFKELQEGSSPATGTFAETEQKVVFVYRKAVVPTNPNKQNPPTTNTPSSVLPKTGETNNNIFVLTFTLLAVLSVGATLIVSQRREDDV